MSSGVIDTYRSRTRRGEIHPDPAQEAATLRLDALARALESYRPAQPTRGFLGRWRAGRAVKPPRGLYLHGPVGSGKSMLMDLFFAAAPVRAKRRVHFHEFMLEVHAHLHALRRNGSGADEPITALVELLAADVHLLCFDEFVVFNIADAMILGRLFEGLLSAGVVVVATSNFPPERLYEGGLNRDRFVPFIELLRASLDVVEVAGGQDYRLARLHDVAVYHQPLGPESARRLEAAFAALTDGAAGAAEELAVGARRLHVPRAAEGVAWFDFAELCEQPLGAADYLALTEHYHTVILGGVPVLTPDRRNAARRLMTFIDALYERRVKLVMSAEAPPDRLYPEGQGSFEFKRTASRLMEMQSRAYVESGKSAGRAGADFAFALTTDLT